MLSQRDKIIHPGVADGIGYAGHPSRAAAGPLDTAALRKMRTPPVVVVAEREFTVVPAIHEVIHGTKKLNSQGPGHGNDLIPPDPHCQLLEPLYASLSPQVEGHPAGRSSIAEGTDRNLLSGRSAVQSKAGGVRPSPGAETGEWQTFRETTKPLDIRGALRPRTGALPSYFESVERAAGVTSSQVWPRRSSSTLQAPRE